MNPVGLIGLGRMGTALGHRLLDLDHHLVVWNRTPAAAAALSDRGASVAASPAEVASRCPAVLVILRDGDALRDVYQGSGGLAAGPLADTLVIEMTTAARSDILRAAALVTASGGRFIDAPVSGTVEPARRGQLVVMAGGEAADLDQARPLLSGLARKIVHAGPVGAGIVLKLVVNLPLAIYWQTLGEALGIGHRHGLMLDAMLDVVTDSKAAIGALAGKLPQIRDSTAPVQFDLAGLHKDLTAMCRAAEELRFDVPTTAAAAKSAGAAVAAGWGNRDLGQLVRFVSESAIGGSDPQAKRRTSWES